MNNNTVWQEIFSALQCSFKILKPGHESFTLRITVPGSAQNISYSKATFANLNTCPE